MAASLLSSLAALGFVVCWSSGFIGGRLAIEVALPPMALFVWRFALATLLVALWWRAWGTRSASRQGLCIEAGIGCLTMGGYLLGVMLAIQAGVGTGITALITALQPLLATLLASLLLGQRSGGLRWLGMIIASVGVILCVAGDLDNADGAPLWAYGLPLLSVVSVTLGSILAARYPTALAMDATLTAQLAAATGVFLIAALIEGHGRIALPALDSATLTAIGWLVFFSSLGGYGFFVACLRRFGVNLTSTLIYLTPPVTMAWAAMMFGDMPGALGIIGMLAASAGVGVAMIGTGKRAPGAPSNVDSHLQACSR